MPRPLLTRRVLVRAAVILAAWTAFGLIIAEQTTLQLQLRGEERSAWSILAPAMVASWMWAAYTPIVVVITRRLRPVRERGGWWWVAYLAVHAAAALVLSVVGAASYAWVRPFIDGTVTTFRAVFSTGLLMDTTSYVAVATLTEAVRLAALYRDRDRAAAELARTAAELRERLEEARLLALESQLRPHFIYNTLNVIAELVYEEPAVADEMLTRLGLLLRRTYVDGPPLVPLGEELDFALAFAGILTRRFADRVTLTVDVPAELRPIPVPAYALQPLVENAFRHGVARREGATQLELTAARHNGSLVVHVRDRGTGAPCEPATQRDGGGGGVGLRNTRERLAALYGSAAGLTLERAAGETTATLWVPAAP